MFKKSLAALAIASVSSLAAAQDMATYQVTITNLTPGQSFTPQLVMTHDSSYTMFRLGDPSDEALEALAEGGATDLIMDNAANAATDMQVIPGLLGPGERATVTVQGYPGQDFLTVGSMLLPTNDTFFAVHRVRLPEEGGTARRAFAYDAGTEANTQNCRDIPGPRCGGEPISPAADSDEGFVHISNGFHDLGDSDADGNEILGPATYDWRNFVARVSVQRLN